VNGVFRAYSDSLKPFSCHFDFARVGCDHLSAFAASLANRVIPQSSVSALIGATVECVGSILIVTGLETRFAAMLMIVFVALEFGPLVLHQSEVAQ